MREMERIKICRCRESNPSLKIFNLTLSHWATQAIMSTWFVATYNISQTFPIAQLSLFMNKGRKIGIIFSNHRNNRPQGEIPAAMVKNNLLTFYRTLSFFEICCSIPCYFPMKGYFGFLAFFPSSMNQLIIFFHSAALSLDFM